MTKPFRFGAVEVFAPTAAAWAETVRRIEDTGFSALQIVDHLGFQFAPVPALAAAATATTNLRLATQVFCNDYRHPTMLAKECATLDVLSDGRLEIGLGAGWMAADYDQTGMTMDAAKVRVDRLEEAVAVLNGCFGPGPCSFSGEHYTVSEFNCFPKPVQQPRPPILIGGGSKRMLRMAGREADIVGLNIDLRTNAERLDEPVVGGVMTARAAATGTAEAVDEKLEWVREGAGDRFEDLEFNITAFLTEFNDDRAARAADYAAQLGVEPDVVLQHPFVLIGTAEQMADTLEERRDRFGINYVTFPMPIVQGGYDAVAPIIDRLAGK